MDSRFQTDSPGDVYLGEEGHGGQKYVIIYESPRIARKEGKECGIWQWRFGLSMYEFGLAITYLKV